MQSINWYPGHMAKTMRQLKQDISLIDVVIELLDARIPISSKNPDIDTLAGDKRRIVALNKADIANPDATALWKRYYEDRGFSVVTLNSLGNGAGEVISRAKLLCVDKANRLKERGWVGVSIRAMILGVPNVGKSTLINRLAGRSATKTADTSGVTRGKQWIKLSGNVELLDTPGVLWPRMNDTTAALKLAFTGSVNDDIMDITLLAAELIKALHVCAPASIKMRYNIEYDAGINEVSVLEMIGKARGFLKRGGVIDIDRAAIILVDEFRGGKLGRISLETPAEELGEGKR